MMTARYDPVTLSYPEIYEIKLEEDLEQVTTSREDSTSPSTSTSSPEQLPRNVCPTTCSICGDTATGYHYEVPSCNGCKTFFRRTVLAQKKYECKKGWECFKIMPKEKRCSCRACRFKACVDVGMNPLAIQTEEDLGQNDMIRTIIRKRTLPQPQQQSPSESKLVPINIITLDQQISNLIDGLLYLEIKKDTLRKSAYNPDPLTLPSLKEILRANNTLSLADKVGPMPNWPLEMSSFRPDHKCHGPPPFNPFKKHWFIFDMLVCVEYAKTFPFFHYLSEEDQVILTKNVTMLCFMLMQAFFSYENKSDTLIHPDGTGIWKGRPDHPHVQQVHQIKKQTIEPLIRSQLTRKEYVLLKAILLCNSGLSDLSDYARQVLDEERNRHSQALFKICMAEGGISNGPARYASILAMVDNLEHLSKQQKDMHLLLKMHEMTRKAEGFRRPEIPILEELLS